MKKETYLGPNNVTTQVGWLWLCCVTGLPHHWMVATGGGGGGSEGDGGVVFGVSSKYKIFKINLLVKQNKKK